MGTFVNIHDFRKKLEEYLLYAEHPIVITRRQMPIGYFIPAKVWYLKDDSDEYKNLMSALLDASGFSEQDVEDSIEAFIQNGAGNLRKKLRHE